MEKKNYGCLIFESKIGSYAQCFTYSIRINKLLRLKCVARWIFFTMKGGNVCRILSTVLRQCGNCSWWPLNTSFHSSLQSGRTLSKRSTSSPSSTLLKRLPLQFRSCLCSPSLDTLDVKGMGLFVRPARVDFRRLRKHRTVVASAVTLSFNKPRTRDGWVTHAGERSRRAGEESLRGVHSSNAFIMAGSDAVYDGGDLYEVSNGEERSREPAPSFNTHGLECGGVPAQTSKGVG